MRSPRTCWQTSPNPVEVLADSAYGGGQTRHDLTEAGHTTVIKPLPLVPPVPDGLDRDDFTIDYQARTVTCPNNHTVTISTKGNANFGRLCDGCPLPPGCTKSKSGRSLHIGEHDQLLAAARAQAKTSQFTQTYRRRPLVERSLAWIVRKGHRRCPYRGVERNQLWLSLRVAAVNLTRLLGLGLYHEDGWKVRAAT